MKIPNEISQTNYFLFLKQKMRFPGGHNAITGKISRFPSGVNCHAF